MEPQIRFCTSADGTRIAYWVLGEGPLILNVASWADNPELMWEDPESRTALERMALEHRYVTAMRRGTAASQRDVSDLSLDAQIADVVAVVEQLGVAPTDILSAPDASPVVLAYAARYPEKVRRLVLWGPFAYGPGLTGSVTRRQIMELMRTDWSIARRMLAAIIWPNGPVDTQRRWSNLWRESIAPETARRYIEWGTEVDIRDCLPLVRAPTLIVSRRRMGLVTMAASRPVAALIPDCRFLALDGEIAHAFHGDVSWIDTALAFWDEGREKASTAASAHPEALEAPAGTAIILFADIVDSTALTERVGDAAFRAKARDLDATLRTIIRDNAGTPIEGKLLGDGVLATFVSAAKAIEAALACGRSGDDAGLPLHLGLHAGDVIREDNNVFGGAVNVAARISGLSAPGEVLVSTTVRDLARTSAGVRFEDRGEQALKGVGEAVRLFSVSSA